MVTELTLIKLLMTDRDILYSYGSYIKAEALSVETKKIVEGLRTYYDSFEGQGADLSKFSTWFLQIRNPDLQQDEQAIYKAIFGKVDKEEIASDDAFTKEVLNHFRREYAKDKIRDMLNNEGLSRAEIVQELDNYQAESGILEEQDFVETNFDNVFVKKKRTEGLHWRLPALNQSIGPIIAGDFGYVAAYVDTGKTKFLVSEVAHMVQQIHEGSVLWFNNEGPEDRIQAQLMGAVLETTQQKIIDNLEYAQQKYTEKLNGDVDRIKIFDAVGFTPSMIREKAEKYNAKLIIIDMLDHIQVHGSGKSQEVIRLKNLYREIRDISKDFCPVIGTSQCDGSVTWTDNATGEARFQHYIGMHQLDFSRSAKQAAAEFIITIGRDAQFPETRYIHVPKNKLDGDGTGLSRNIKTEVLFDGKRSLYLPPQ